MASLHLLSNGHCNRDGGGQWGLLKIWKSTPRKGGVLGDIGFPPVEKVSNILTNH